MPPEEGIENWDFRWWAITTIPGIYWWADAALHSDAASGIASWTTLVPELEYTEVPLEITADVVFKAGTCWDGSPACRVTTGYYYEGDRDASYWSQATIFIDFSFNWTADGRKSAVAHEMGHLYGLHERYIDPRGACNNSDYTIMDGLQLISGYVVHCDFLTGPVSIDDTRVTSYWSNGAYSSFTATPFGTAGVWEWKNDAWAPYFHRVTYYYYDWSIGWVPYEVKAITADIGVHRITEDRTMSDLINRLNYPAVPGPAWHIACGHPRFEAFDTFGDWVCSNYIYLN